MDLVPLIAVVVLSRYRDVSRAAWLLAAAWFFSWVGSSIQHYAGGIWWHTYLWSPPQLTLAIAAFLPEWWMLTAVGALFVTAVSASLSAPGPDVLLTVLGSLCILVVARSTYRLPAAIYFGVGTVMYLAMIARRPEDMLPAWQAYQGTRAAAYIMFVALLIFREPKKVPT